MKNQATKQLAVKEKFSSHSSLSKRKFFKNNQWISLPNLIGHQVSSYEWFLKEGLREILDEISPISDFTGKEMELSFGEYYLDEPKYDEVTAKDKNISYDAPLRVKARLLLKRTGEVREQELFLTDFPIMTEEELLLLTGRKSGCFSVDQKSWSFLYYGIPKREKTFWSQNYSQPGSMAGN